MEKTNKKGISLGDAVPAIMIIATLFIVLIIVVYVLATLQGSFVNLATVSVQNETTGAITDAGTYAAHASDCNFGSFAVVRFMNKTSGATIPASNFTTNSIGKIIPTSTNFNNSAINVTYTANTGGSACTAANSLTIQVVNALPIAGLVLIIVLIAIVVTVLLSAMIMRRKGEGRI